MTVGHCVGQCVSWSVCWSVCCVVFIQRLQKQVEHWMEKYDKDVEAKQKDLDILKASKAKDLERLQYLSKLVSVGDMFADRQ